MTSSEMGRLTRIRTFALEPGRSILERLRAAGVRAHVLCVCNAIHTRVLGPEASYGCSNAEQASLWSSHALAEGRALPRVGRTRSAFARRLWKRPCCVTADHISR